MTAVVSRERARGAYLTGAAGAVLIAIAALMMIVAAPGHARTAGSGPAQPATIQPAAIQPAATQPTAIQPATTQLAADTIRQATALAS